MKSCECFMLQGSHGGHQDNSIPVVCSEKREKKQLHEEMMTYIRLIEDNLFSD